MTVAVVVAICLVVLVLAFLAPRLSRHAERGSKLPFDLGSRATSKAPGRAGTWLSKPFRSSSKAIGRSGSAGRRGRGKLPL